MLQWIKKVFAQRPDRRAERARATYRLGEAEALRQNNASAARLIREAIALDPGQPQFHYALGCVLQGGGEDRAAAAAYRAALALDRSHAAAHINLGCLLQARAERAGGEGFDEALAHFRAAAEIAPGSADAWINLGYARARSRELAEACDCYDRALALDPTMVAARFNRSMVLLARGHWRQGWDDYEWRWPASGFPRPIFPQPEWDGAALRGETVMLYTEQGYGDAIQFVRYAPLVQGRGGRVIVRCPRELQRLLAGVPGVSATLAPDETAQFDLHCSLLGLPRAFGTTPDTIPAQIPYVSADPALAAQWRRRVHDGRTGLRIGLVWASHSQMPNAGQKSTTLQALRPIASMPGTLFYSLQVGAAGREAAAAGPIPLTDLTGEIRDFAETAALIANLDLIISVDTAVAHLAGAMGAPVWTLLPYAPDWRWYPDAPASRWYPHMRLFRQGAPGDWSGVATQVAKSLREHLAAGPPDAAPTFPT